MTAPFARQRAPALLLTLLIHLGLFACWQMARQPRPALPSAPMRWLTLLTLRLPATTAPPPAQKRAPAAAITARHRNVASAADTAATPGNATPAAATAVEATAAAAAPDGKEAAVPIVAPLEAGGRSAADIMRQAKRDLHKIDSDLRAADAKWVRAPASTPYSRMQAAFDAAKDAVPPKWYEAARITPIGDQSSGGPRMYKVVSAFGTYCIRIAGNHSLADSLPKGDSKQDQMSTGIRPTYSTCPK